MPKKKAAAAAADAPCTAKLHNGIGGCTCDLLAGWTPRADPPPPLDGLRLDYMPVDDLAPAKRNPKTHDNLTITGSVSRFGYVEPIVLDERTHRLVAGHGRREALLAMRQANEDPPQGIRLGEDGRWLVPVVRGWASKSDAEAEAYLLVSNQATIAAGWDDLALAKMLQDLSVQTDVEGLGWDEDQLAELLRQVSGDGAGGEGGGEGGDGSPGSAAGSMVTKFIVPPFSVLDARQGYWQDRKKDWLALGIQSEVGRDAPSYHQDSLNTVSGQDFATGTSIFDPVLCELAYRWFSPAGAVVLDPFAGGSVRGVIAAALGRTYHGIDLRPEQVAANAAQWATLGPRLARLPAPAAAPPPEDHMPDVTPVEQLGDVWVKRDDAFMVNGIRGGKVRTCWALAQGAAGLTTAGSRFSPQVAIVGRIAAKLGIPFRAHVPTGEPGPELEDARRHGADLVAHTPGHNSVIVARARADAKARGWVEIPFGMECQAAVDATRRQVANVPADVERIVVPVGSGMSLAGILWGLRDLGRDLPVLGVQVGADPTKRLDRYAPPGWQSMVQLVPSGLDYSDPAPVTAFRGLALDPYYEAKVLPHLQPGDLLWVVGIRPSAEAPAAAPAQDVPAPTWYAGDSLVVLGEDPSQLPRDLVADLVFTCPPYADLERYSDDPRDLSTMDYPGFLDVYGQILALAFNRLREHRFAVVVVGDARDRVGAYYGFVADTIKVAQAAGLALYNEAILVTPAGTLPFRAGHHFSASRKLGKGHQNVLVFVKGDPKLAAAAMGPVVVDLPAEVVADGPAEEA